MTWNWQLKDWPHYIYDPKVLLPLEQAFFKASGAFVGVFNCLDAAEQEQVKIDLLSEEALNTSAIEGVILNRDSLQASLKREFGLATEKRHITMAEKGIAQMMLEVYRDYSASLTHECLFSWNTLVNLGRNDLDSIGAYRVHPEPMLIVSGGTRQPTIHFEAPPSNNIPALMTDYIEWFNRTAPNGPEPLPPLVRAGVAHVYFESIHPFEDGNGRIGRALAEKALAQSLGHPTLIALSTVTEQNKKGYYSALQTTNHSLSLDSWLLYFAETVLQAQTQMQSHIEFLIKKAKFFDKYDVAINQRQRKVLLRMFRAGVSGFQGGLSAENYLSITGTSRATATRDLNHLVELGALSKKGELRYTRYFLNLR